MGDKWFDSKKSFKYLNNMDIDKYTWIGPEANDDNSAFLFKCSKCNEIIVLNVNETHILETLVGCTSSCRLGDTTEYYEVNPKLNKLIHLDLGKRICYNSKGYLLPKSDTIVGAKKIQLNMAAIELDVLVNHMDATKHRPRHVKTNHNMLIGGSKLSRKKNSRKKNSRKKNRTHY
jgi:hypothetical protein